MADDLPGLHLRPVVQPGWKVLVFMNGSTRFSVGGLLKEGLAGLPAEVNSYGFITNYRDAAEAAAGVAETLTVKRSSLAVIPTAGGGESFTHELLCRTADGQDVLVYKDTVTGKEDDILILLYSDHGVLTK